MKCRRNISSSCGCWGSCGGSSSTTTGRYTLWRWNFAGRRRCGRCGRCVGAGCSSTISGVNMIVEGVEGVGVVVKAANFHRVNGLAVRALPKHLVKNLKGGALLVPRHSQACFVCRNLLSCGPSKAVAFASQGNVTNNMNVWPFIGRA